MKRITQSIPQCAAKPGAKRGFVRGTRKDGTTFSAPAIVGGTRCTKLAMISRQRNGKTIYRCLEHQNWEAK